MRRQTSSNGFRRDSSAIDRGSSAVDRRSNARHSLARSTEIMSQSQRPGRVESSSHLKRNQLSVRYSVFLACVTLLMGGVCFGFGVHSLVDLGDRSKGLDDSEASQAVLEFSVRCIFAIGTETGVLLGHLDSPSDASLAAVRNAETATARECGVAVLVQSRDLFEQTLSELGNIRKIAKARDAVTYDIAMNYSSLSAVSTGRGAQAAALLPTDALAELFSGSNAAGNVVLVHNLFTLFEGLALIGSYVPKVEIIAYNSLETVYMTMTALGSIPQFARILASPAFQLCGDELFRPLARHGSTDMRNVCEPTMELFRSIILDDFPRTIATREDRLDTYTSWRTGLIVVVVVVGLVVAYSVTTIVFSQQQSLKDLEDEIESRKAITDSVQAFVPAQFLVLLGLRVITDLAVDEPQTVEMSVLASDIRQFTAISEQMTDVELFAWLQEHLSNMTGATRRAGGFIDKYIGDAVVCVFSSPSDALRCAVDMQFVVEETNVARRTRGEEHMVRVGVGIHHGPAVVGILGDDITQNSTVVGRPVDVAAKLEELTKVYGAKIIVTEEAFEMTGMMMDDFRRLGAVKIDGQMVNLVDVYATEPVAVRQYKTATRPQFEAAVAARDRGNIKFANESFDSVLAAPRPPGYSDLAAEKVIEM